VVVGSIAFVLDGLSIDLSQYSAEVFSSLLSYFLRMSSIIGFVSLVR